MKQIDRNMLRTGSVGRAHLLALEPRMMFDAAMAATTEAVGRVDAPLARADAVNSGLPVHVPAPIDAFRPAPALDAAPAENEHAASEGAPTAVGAPDYGATTLSAFDRDASDGGVTRIPVDTAHDQSNTSSHEPASAATQAIVFIDTSVGDYQQLAARWASQAQVVLIDGTRDGIDQIRAALAGQTDISAIHIVSHGDQGEFWIGTTRVDQAAIDGDLAGSLAAIGRSLEQNGDILIYGCDFAEGDAGAAALASFARATGADVAASTDLTGFAPRGGDWVLEAHSGSIEARSLDGGDWAHTLDPNQPVPISVTADSLTVTNGAGTVVVSGANGYGNDSRSPDVGAGSVARWAGAATFNGQNVDLLATVVSLSAGDAVRFNRPTGTGANGDDPTFLLRDLTTGASDAIVQIRWSLVVSGTNTELPADVRFTISDIDGIGGKPNTRESVSTSTENLAYYTRERVTDIAFTSSLDRITASGTQNENPDTTLPATPQSAATFDWTKVSSFDLTYTLATNTVTTQAQFYQDGDADFRYSDPVYISIPRLDLDGDDSTATGNDAHFTFTENGPGVPVVDSDVVVVNPMAVDAILSASVTLTNYQTGDVLSVGTLPANITASVGPVSNGRIVVTLSGNGTERDYATALKAVSFSNTSDTPDTTQRVLTVSFSNDTLTSAVATSRIDVIPVNDAPTARADSATTAEDTAVTIAVLANDTDPESDPLTVTSASALHGSVVRNADGTLTYTPDANYNGSDTISYAISDGQGGVSNATVAVTITPVNDAPTPVGGLPDRASSDGSAVSYATAGSFTDIDGDTLRYSATGLPAGLTIDATSGVIAGTIDRSASQIGGGVYAIVVTARDPSNASATQSFTLSATNPVPTAVDDSATTAEDTAITIAVLGNDTDPDGDLLTVTAASALHGSVLRNADGTLTYTPNANYNGSDTISYAISDGQGGVSNATVTVTITPVNDAPTPVGGLPDRASSDGSAVSYATAGSFTDIDGDTLRYSATGLPAGLTIDPTSGIISGTIDRSASQIGGGRYAVVVTARDPSDASTTQSFMLTATNPAPTAVNDRATTVEDTAVAIAALANDTDPDSDPLTVTSASALHGSVVRNADGTLTYTPDANYNGSDTISYVISDGQGGVSNATVAVTITPVNDAPMPVGGLPDRASSDGAAVSYATAGSFSDVDGDTLRYSATGLPAGLTIDPTSGVISGTIDRSASQIGGGVYAIVVTARDPSNASEAQSFTLSAINPAPTAFDDRATTAEDTAVTIVVLRNDTDPDGDPLTVTSASAPHGSVVRNADGTLTYTPDADYNGSDTISYAISDGQGGVSNATVAITIAPVNDAPVANGTLASQAARDGASVSYATAGGFRDVDGDALRYSASGLPVGLAIDPVTGVISGTIDRSASQSGAGTYAVVVTARDPSGATATQGFVLDVVNPAPVASADTAIAHVDTPVIIDVLGNDTDPDGDPLTVVDARAGRGSVVILADGTLRYTPPAGFVGQDTVVYTISDGQGGTSTAMVAITIGNAAPTTGAGGNQSVVDGQTVSLPVGASVTDADGDPLTFTATGLPAGLSIDPATGLVSGIVDRGASQVKGGVYDSVVTANDGHGGTSTTLLHWTITNPAPITRDDTASVDEDGVVVISPLGNDSDPDGDTLTIVSAVAAHGQVTINPDGTIAYRPDKDFNGTDTIAYVITDGDGARANASIVVTVAARNDAPTTTGLPARSDVDAEMVSIPTSAVFTDADGDTLTYSATGLPTGLSIDPRTGVISGTITPGSARGGTDGQGHYAVVVTATDPSGRSADAPFAWTVLDAGPIARADTATTRENMPVTIPVLANDSDPDGDPLTLVEAVASHGTATIVDGTIVFTPDQGFDGTAIVTYQVSDPAGNRTSASVTITVVAANDAPVGRPLGDLMGKDGQPVTLDIGGFFADPDGDALRFSATGLPAGLSIDPDSGRISGVVDRSASQVPGGLYRVVVTATDPSGATTSSAFDWAITNAAPIAANDSATTAEDAPVRIVVLGNDVDPDGDPLSVVSANAGHGTVVIDADGSLGYTPDADFNGNDVIVYTISDGQGGTASASVLVTITPVPDAPRAFADQVTLVANSTIDIPVLANDSDPDGNPLTIVAATATSGTVSINADGTLHYESVAGFVGTDVIRYTIDDGQSGTASADVMITVNPVNDAPVAIGSLPDRATSDGAAIAYPTAAAFADANGDMLTYAATGLPAGLSIDPATGVISGTIVRGASQLDGGRYDVVVTARDPSGATATQVFALTTINPAPIARDDTARTNEETGVVIPVLANDGDPDGGPITVTGAVAANGVVRINADGTLAYVPGPNFTGTDTIRYTIADADGATATALVTVTVDAVNHAPVTPVGAAPVDATGGRPTRIAVLDGVTDRDGDPLTLTGATTANGIVVVNPDNTVTFTPALGFVGNATITYSVSDGRGGIATGTVVVRVADGRGADIQQLLEFGRPRFIDPTPRMATIRLGDDGEARNPLSVLNPPPVLNTVEGIRSLNATTIGDRPVGDAVEAIRSLRGTGIGSDSPILAEVARLEAVRDQRDAGDRLFDHRWGDFMVQGLTGFSAAADRDADIAVESVVRGGAIYVEVRDMAEDGRPTIRSVDVRLAGGGAADFIHVDHRGLAIIERGADMDELHLVVRVTRENGRTTSTPIVIQGQTGEIELDRPAPPRDRAAPLDRTLNTPLAAAAADAARLSDLFQ